MDIDRINCFVVFLSIYLSPFKRWVSSDLELAASTYIDLDARSSSQQPASAHLLATSTVSVHVSTQ
jgi:hypothetical protein